MFRLYRFGSRSLLVLGLISAAFYMFAKNNGDMQEQIFDLLFLGKLPYSEITLPFGFWLLVTLLIVFFITTDWLIHSIVARRANDPNWIEIEKAHEMNEFIKNSNPFDLISL